MEVGIENNLQRNECKAFYMPLIAAKEGE